MRTFGGKSLEKRVEEGESKNYQKNVCANYLNDPLKEMECNFYWIYLLYSTVLTFLSFKTFKSQNNHNAGFQQNMWAI